MIDKVEVMATSPKILTLNDNDIFSYFKKENINYSKSKDYILVSNFKGLDLKIFKSGIAKTRPIFEGTEVNEKLIKSANEAQKIATELFQTNVIYDVSIYKKRCPIKLNPKDVPNDNVEVETLSLSIDDLFVDIKITSSGYWVTIKGISDIDKIENVYKQILRKDIFQNNSHWHLN
jgi:hypothetical protein